MPTPADGHHAEESDSPPGRHDDPEAHDSGAHDPDAMECRFCPLCTTVRLARATSPEVRDHLNSAGMSLALALQGLLDGMSEPTRGATPVEKIDLAED
ncbi:MAG: hypothetical protein H0V07_13200 [Propionibacteriales bacterium]|nr:hypothetical protein [Propionibacteriales bacterium]